MLSSGAQRLAESKAVVKSLTDVETLGGTTVINSDKTGTLTMNAMTATTMLTGGEWYKVEGGGYRTTGRDPRHAGGPPTPDFTSLGLGLVLCSDATVAADESIIGDPTEAALVVLAAKVGVDAEETRRSLPRRTTVPFDSEYKFMATFHDRPDAIAGGILDEPHFVSVKGAPDIVIDRCCDRVVARRSGSDGAGPRTSCSPPTSSSPSAGCGSWRSPSATSRRGHDRRARRSDGARSTTSSWCRSSGSSTRCAPRPSTPSASRTPQGSTCG